MTLSFEETTMNAKVGLVGIGRLGTALMNHWCKNRIKVGIYHPNQSKAERFVQRFSNGYILTRNELDQLDYLILALSAKDIVPFISKLSSESLMVSNLQFINMATALQTKQLKEQFPNYEILGIKYMGHAKDLLDNGNGLFISESKLPSEIEILFNYLGKIVIDSEEILNEVNRVATYYAIKASMEIDTIMTKKGLSSDYVERALTSLAPYIMRSYYEGNLGHFAKDIVKEIQNGKQ